MYERMFGINLQATLRGRWRGARSWVLRNYGPSLRARAHARCARPVFSSTNQSYWGTTLSEQLNLFLTCALKYRAGESVSINELTVSSRHIAVVVPYTPELDEKIIIIIIVAHATKEARFHISIIERF